MAFAFVGEIAKALTDARDAIPLIKKELEKNLEISVILMKF